jgi:hypothetical protein
VFFSVVKEQHDWQNGGSIAQTDMEAAFANGVTARAAADDTIHVIISGDPSHAVDALWAATTVQLSTLTFLSV